MLLEKLREKKQNSFGPFDFEALYPLFRESIIQRFEYTIELTWKYCKKLLEQKDISVEYNAPVPVIRTAYASGLLQEDIAETLLRAIKDRNRTSHIYKEAVAEELIAHIPLYAATIKKIIQLN